jgi:hypothetical protein
MGPDSHLQENGVPYAATHTINNFHYVYRKNSYDAAKELWFMSEQAYKFALLPAYGQNSYGTDHVLLPDSLFEEKATVAFEFVSDYTTKNFRYFRDRGVSVHNPCIKAGYQCIVPLTKFVKCTLWDRSSFPNGGVTSVLDTKYLRVDCYGIQGVLAENADLEGLYGFQSVPSRFNQVFATFSGSKFGSLSETLDQFQHAALDKASRGVADVIVSLIELPKTVKMVRRLLRNVGRLKSLPAVIASDTFYVQRPTARTAAKAWLEGRYGWRQIVFDVQGLGRLIAGVIKRYRRSYTSGTKLTGGMYVESEWTDYITLGTTQYRLRHISTKAQLRAGVAVESNMTTSWNKKFYHLVGGFNPLSILWELTKLSWMLDWVVDIGSLFTVWARDPARYSRAWHTLDMPYESSIYVLQGEISEADILPAAYKTATGAGFQTLKNIFLLDDEVHSLVGQGGQCKVYLRAPKDASRFPLVIPRGILIKSGSQIADMLSIMVVRRR